MTPTDPTPTPRRVQLRRHKGYVLQIASRRLNGLDAVKCDRTTVYGNPYPLTESMPAAAAVKRYRDTLMKWPAAAREEFVAPLRGKNLACWCHPSKPCHTDVLLEILATLPPAP